MQHSGFLSTAVSGKSDAICSPMPVLPQCSFLQPCRLCSCVLLGVAVNSLQVVGNVWHHQLHPSAVWAHPQRPQRPHHEGQALWAEAWQLSSS